MSLIQRLMELQETHGHLSEETLRTLSLSQRVPLHRLQEITSFYPHFHTSPPPKIQVAVCRDIACWLNGGAEALQRFREASASAEGIHIQEVSCLGRCDFAPACTVNGIPGTLGGGSTSPREGLVSPRVWRCDPYAWEESPFQLLRKLLSEPREVAAARVLAALKASGLRGMGGAAFPTATKWELVRDQVRSPKYVICNADESEPGTFKDREILARSPHLVLEGMLLAGLVTGAERGILFLRHEYAQEGRLFRHLLDRVRHEGLLGENIARSHMSFDVEVFLSPGGYILGEETALLECLEDRRGEPRNKPPFPGTHGLFGQPTLINNVETLALIPGIVKNGPEWWKSQGRPGFAGVKFVAVSGHVEKPGVQEVSVGTTVREVIDQAGGVKDGRELLAFAPGGASAPWLPASLADTPVDFQTLAQAGSLLGSGAVLVVAEGTSMREVGTNIVRFFRNESCGKCVPCRLGSQKAVELLESVPREATTSSELSQLADLGETMTQTSICGLGQVALNPILSVLKHWPSVAHTDEAPV